MGRGLRTRNHASGFGTPRPLGGTAAFRPAVSRSIRLALGMRWRKISEQSGGAIIMRLSAVVFHAPATAKICIRFAEIASDCHRGEVKTNDFVQLSGKPFSALTAAFGGAKVPAPSGAGEVLRLCVKFKNTGT